MPGDPANEPTHWFGQYPIPAQSFNCVVQILPAQHANVPTPPATKPLQDALVSHGSPFWRSQWYPSWQSPGLPRGEGADWQTFEHHPLPVQSAICLVHFPRQHAKLPTPFTVYPEQSVLRLHGSPSCRGQWYPSWQSPGLPRGEGADWQTFGHHPLPVQSAIWVVHFPKQQAGLPTPFTTYPVQSVLKLQEVSEVVVVVVVVGSVVVVGLGSCSTKQ